MPTGWTGRILEVDLGARSHRTVQPGEEILRRFVGGKGLAGYYLAPHATLPWDHPDMPLLLFAGPLVGTGAPTSGRMTIMSRSPLTGTVGDASVGGRLGTELKRAGWDGIIVRGRAADWTGVDIRDAEVRFLEANELVGLPTGEAADRLGDEGAMALVGPAAERGVRFASVIVDRHFAAARNGLGLVFGAKKLKFLTVRGSGKVAVADPGGLAEARDQIFRLVAAAPILLGEHGIRNLGTPALYDLMDARRMMPTRNFRATYYPPARELNAGQLRERYQPVRAGCRGCHIRCKKKTADGTPLPEFETLSHFTALVGNDDLGVAVRANVLCNELGMDTITAAATLSCYAEIAGEDLGPERLLTLLREMGEARPGVGAELAEGSWRYARAHGRPELSIAVKAQELPAYDPRGAYGMALAYATSTRGGCHLRAYPISHEILRKPVATDRFSFEGKARIIKIAEDMNAVIDSLTACKFVFFGSSLEEYAKAFAAVTGVPMTATGLSRIGERIYYHERMMNARNGFTAADDDLPPRFFAEAGTDGPSFAVAPLDRAEFLATRSRYYRARGLTEDGLPLADKAAELELEWNG